MTADIWKMLSNMLIIITSSSNFLSFSKKEQYYIRSTFTKKGTINVITNTKRSMDGNPIKILQGRGKNRFINQPDTIIGINIASVIYL